MRAVLTILAKDLRLRLRDRSAIVVGVVAPFGLAAILNLVTGGFGQDFSATFGVVDEDRGEVSAAFTRVVENLDEDIEVRTGLSADQARRQVDGGDLDAAFVLPAGLSERVASAAEPGQVRVRGNVDAQIATSIARAVAEGFTERLNAVRLSVAVALTGGDGPAGQPGQPGQPGQGELSDRGDRAGQVDQSGQGDQGDQEGEVQPGEQPDQADLAELVAAAQRQEPPVQLVEATATDRELDGTTYLMAGMAVFFVFFLVQYGVVGLLEERRDGTMARLLAAPVSRLAVPLAKALTSLVLGVSGLLVLAVGSTLILGAEWGPAPAVALLIVAVVLAAVSLVGVVAGIARTAEQAGGIQSVIALVLGLLGGSFFPVSLNDGALTRLAVITPHHWFLRGLGDARGGGVADALPAVLALLAFAAVVSCVGAALLVRKVEP